MVSDFKRLFPDRLLEQGIASLREQTVNEIDIRKLQDKMSYIKEKLAEGIRKGILTLENQKGMKL